VVAADPRDELIASQQRTIAALTESIERLSAQVAELKRMLFGQSSERVAPSRPMPPVARELAKRHGDDAAVAARKQKAADKRAANAAKKLNLPVVDVEHRIESCPHCQSKHLEDLKSPEVSEEIEFVPAHFVRKRHARQKAKCLECRRIVTAAAPPRVDDGCLWGPGLHAHTVVSKVADAIPLYRLAKRFKRDGLPIERSSLLRLYHRSADLLAPIARRILELVAQAERVNADETPVFVQAPEKCHQGYMWTFLADSLIGFVFSPSRSGETPRQVLGGSQGTLQVDAYTGYNAVTTPEGRMRVGCLAHVRRRFFNALDTAPDDAKAALDGILSLYDVEYEAAARDILGTSEHLALRRELTAERLDKLEAWMREKQALYPPKSPMGQALRYALKTWPSMRAVLDDPKLRLDNNLAENALRVVSLGRKNYLFVGDDEGGEHLATLLTVVSTCVAAGVNPEAYIADVLLRVGTTPSSRIDTLLPAAWKTTQDTSRPAIN
jgi:transposase